MTCQNDEEINLFDAKIGNSYKISEIKLRKETARRLEMLGMTKGAVLTVMNRKRSGSTIIKVRGTRFALGKNFVRGIIIGGRA